MKNIAVLGSTGSIGRNTLEVIDKLRHRFNVVGLSGGRNTQQLVAQVDKFQPKIVSLERKEEAEEFKKICRIPSLRVTYAQEGAEEVAGYDENDIVVSAITGINGLRPTLAAVRTGKKVALANKESMVVAGPLIQDMANEFKTQIIPVDSEHSGIFQCLAKEHRKNIRRVILTASGGPFFSASLQEMENITLEQALDHPRWRMGKKVTIDSATLVNKGLELIEARWLFGLMPQQLGILIHPQSIVHSLVELRDGSVLAQLSPTDMRVPIQFALTYPEREDSLLPSLDLAQIRALEFFEVDMERFPLISLARRSLEEGESLPVAFNAANEVVVQAFLDNKIKFLDIPEIMKEIFEGHKKKEVKSLEEILVVDRETRDETWNLLRKRF